jgi:Kae1-associated kinase Bud32
MAELVKRGAEAALYLKGGELVKERIEKGYRLEILDERIRRQRTRRENKLMLKAGRAGAAVPKIFGVGDFEIKMEYLGKETVKKILNDLPEGKRREICKMIGESIARLHSAGIIHGDLTTSNMVYKDGKIYLIDFGLGKSSRRVEDYATDLYLLFEALISTHFGIHKEAWEAVLGSYRRNFPNAKEVLNRLERIKGRRRYAGRKMRYQTAKAIPSF